MQIFKTLFLSTGALALLLFISSCEHSVSTESIVHEDGSIDRTVVLAKADSGAMQQNMFGINQQQGWEVEAEVDKESNQKEYIIVFRKHFTSVDEANAEMSATGDTLFKIRSEFEKKFRWFYTYMKYSDTYIAINRFTEPDISNYFTAEDFAFIDRLPAEGESISLADSIYLKALNDKIYDVYAARAFYNAYYDELIRTIRKNQLDQRWLDTLELHRENLYQHLLNNENDFDDDFMLEFADSLHIPLSPQSGEDYNNLIDPIKKRTDFMSMASEGKYTHTIKMPWEVIASNADSVNGNELRWAPPVTRFQLKDYRMYAESRKLNYWTVIVSAIIILFTIWMFIRSRRNDI